MTEIVQVRWNNDTRYFSIVNHKKEWKECGNKPRILLHSNGARRKNGDKCFDVSLIIGYTIFNYTNFDLQRRGSNG